MRFAQLSSLLPAVSRVGFGGNVLGYFLDESDSSRLIHRAYDLGINLIDTADVYSNGLSETYIGNAIYGERGRWLIASKVGVESSGSPNGIGRKTTIRKRIEGSLRRLRTDYIDLYQMHHRDPITPVEETVEALTDLVREGKIRCFGLSNYSAEQVHFCTALAQNSKLAKPGAAQAHLNLLKRAICDDLLPLCTAEGIGVLVFGVLARGVLAGRYRNGKPVPKGSRAARSSSVQADLVPEVLETVEALDECAHRFGMSLSHMCIAWALAQTGVTSALVGVRSEAQLAGNVLAADIVLEDECLREIDRIVGPTERFQNINFGQQVMH